MFYVRHRLLIGDDAFEHLFNGTLSSARAFFSEIVGRNDFSNPPEFFLFFGCHAHPFLLHPVFPVLATTPWPSETAKQEPGKKEHIQGLPEINYREMKQDWQRFIP